MIQYPRFVVVLFLALVSLAVSARAQHDAAAAPLAAPISIFSRDSGAGQPSATVGEQQAMRDLDDIARLRKAGVRTEYDLMDASWFAPESGYRTLRPGGWPNGPDAWLASCRAQDIRPGIRIGGNAIAAQTPSDRIPAAWKDSLGDDGRSLSLFEGGYLSDLMSALQSWYDRGVRLFDFDSIDLGAATPAAAGKLGPAEIASRNAAAFRQALQAFGDKNPEAVLLVSTLPGTDAHLAASLLASANAAGQNPAHTRSIQLGAFTLVSTGALSQPQSLQTDFSRTLDIEGDEFVRRLEQSGVALAQIESSGFTASGDADAGMHAWKGPFLLSMARGGWVNSLHGDLSLIRNDDARWMARVQRLFLDLQQRGHLRSFGGAAGSGQPYGFAASSPRGSVYVVVNPGQASAALALPAVGPRQFNQAKGRVQFSDVGFTPRLTGSSIVLGPGQMAMVGYGAFAGSVFDFGVERDVIIPRDVKPVEANFYSTETGALVASFEPPIDGVVRLILRPRASGGKASLDPDFDSGGLGNNAPQAVTLDATQYGRPIPVRLDNGNRLQHGIGWMVGEIDVDDLTPGVPLVVQFHSSNSDMASLEASAYAVEY